MKNSTTFGVKFPILLLIVLVFSSCGSNTKVDPTPPGGGGNGGGGGTTNPIITMPTAPAYVWNGGSYSGTVTVSNPPSGSLLYIDNVLQSSNTGGTINRVNLQPNASVHVELRKSSNDVGVLTSADLPLNVLKPLMSLLNNGVQKWENVGYHGYSSGTWHDFAPGCPSNPSRQFLLTGTCNVYNVPCGTGGNSTPPYSLDDNETHITVSNETVTVLRYTTDSVFTISADGLTKREWVARR